MAKSRGFLKITFTGFTGEGSRVSRILLPAVDQPLALLPGGKGSKVLGALCVLSHLIVTTTSEILQI